MTFTPVLSTVAALCAVLLAIILTGRVVRAARLWYGPDTRAGRMAVVESLALDPRRRLLLVRCDARCVLLLAGEQDQVVGWLPEQAP